MKCERVQELLLTDYMDGLMSDNGRADLDAHLASCAACSQLKSAAQSYLNEFKVTAREEVPSYIWERVKKAAAAEPASRPGMLDSALCHIKEGLRMLARIPKPAVLFAAAAAIIVVLVLARPFTTANGANDYLNEQIDFIYGLDTAEGNGVSYFDIDIGTGAENII